MFPPSPHYWRVVMSNNLWSQDEVAVGSYVEVSEVIYEISDLGGSSASETVADRSI